MNKKIVVGCLICIIFVIIFWVSIPKEKTYKDVLYVPTQITKIEDYYFIMDCWQNRLLYSKDINKPISKWKTMTEETTGGHTLAYDGELYVTEDTEGSRMLVFKRVGNSFEMTQAIDGITGRPHYTLYDEVTERFYTVTSNGGTLHTFVNDGGSLTLESTIQFEELVGSYVRSLSIIDGYMYLTCGPGYISKVDYLAEKWEIVERYPVAPELYNMNYFTKIGEYYYCTINVTGEALKSEIVRVKDLIDLSTGSYESVYQKMEFAGTPYYINFFDDKYFITEVGEFGNNGIRSFEVDENGEIRNVEKIFFFEEVLEDSKTRRAERM